MVQGCVGGALYTLAALDVLSEWKSGTQIKRKSGLCTDQGSPVVTLLKGVVMGPFFFLPCNSQEALVPEVEPFLSCERFSPTLPLSLE